MFSIWVLLEAGLTDYQNFFPSCLGPIRIHFHGIWSQDNFQWRSSQLIFFFLNKCIYLFFYFWLRWVFVATRGLSLVAVSGDYSSLRCAGFSLWWLLLLRSTGSRCMDFSSCGARASGPVTRRLQSAGSAAVAHGRSCSSVCGIFPDQGSNLRPLHWQAYS